ncbi:MAG TPA: cytidine deaminase [Woeseiaceae bacterium]|nr:cytidine deaminase [Woeseiaceae bacterium]
MKTDDDRLLEAATNARRNAYAPYSKYAVGAALADEVGRVHTGCNVENAAFPEGTCAEAIAIGAMVAAGGRRIAAIAIAGGREDLEPCTPCGGCRQKIAEFADASTRILLLDADGTFKACGIDDLLPDSFRLL